MNRNRFFALAAMLILLCLPLAACKSKNPHGLVFVPDGSESVYMLGSDETRSVYALGGTVNCTSGGEMKALSLCLADESISISDVASAAADDLKSERIEANTYADSGTVEYLYDTFTLICLSGQSGNTDIWFVPPGTTAAMLGNYAK